MNENSLLSDVLVTVAVVVSQTPCVRFLSRTLCGGHQAYLGVSMPTVLSAGCLLLKAYLLSYAVFLIT